MNDVGILKDILNSIPITLKTIAKLGKGANFFLKKQTFVKETK